MYWVVISIILLIQILVDLTLSKFRTDEFDYSYFIKNTFNF